MNCFACLDKVLDADRCNFELLISAPVRNYYCPGDGRKRPRRSSKNWIQYAKYMESFDMIKFYETDEFVIYAGNDERYPRDTRYYVVTFEIVYKEPPFERSGCSFQYFYILGDLKDIYQYVCTESRFLDTYDIEVIENKKLFYSKDHPRNNQKAETKSMEIFSSGKEKHHV